GKYLEDNPFLPVLKRESVYRWDPFKKNTIEVDTNPTERATMKQLQSEWSSKERAYRAKYKKTYPIPKPPYMDHVRYAVEITDGELVLTAERQNPITPIGQPGPTTFKRPKKED